MKIHIRNAVIFLTALVLACLFIMYLDLQDKLAQANRAIIDYQTDVNALRQQNTALHSDIEEIEIVVAARDDEIEALRSELEYSYEMIGVRRSIVDLTDNEADMLKRLAMSEAGNQGVIGKALVMLTVINRMEHPTKYNDTIEGVIMSGAYEVTKPGGTFYTCQPDWECDAALYLIQHGWTEGEHLDELGLDPNYQAVYFTNSGYSAYGDQLFQYKNHYFSGWIAEPTEDIEE